MVDPQRKVRGGEDDDMQELLGNLENPREKVLARTDDSIPETRR